MKSQWDTAGIASRNSLAKNYNFIHASTVIFRWNFKVIQGKNSNIFLSIICNLIQQDLASFLFSKLYN